MSVLYGLGHLLLFFLLLKRIESYRSGDKNRGVRTDNNSNDQGEHEPSNAFPSKDENGDQYHKSGQRGIQRTADRTVDSRINILSDRPSRVFIKILPDPVKNYHRIIQGVSHNC